MLSDGSVRTRVPGCSQLRLNPVAPRAIIHEMAALSVAIRCRVDAEQLVIDIAQSRERVVSLGYGRGRRLEIGVEAVDNGGPSGYWLW